LIEETKNDMSFSIQSDGILIARSCFEPMTRFRKLMLVSLGLLLLPPVIATLWNDHYRCYGLSGCLAWVDSLGDPETRFAPGFSERLFDKVKPGMTQNEVEHVLGEPLDRIPWPLWERFYRWDYSDSVTNVNDYHMRSIIFHPDGKVAWAVREYYREEAEEH
jgi:hypothetical protein